MRDSPRVPLSSTADGLSSYLGKLDDSTYFSAMRADILNVQRRLRAFATPVKGAEVSEASMQLIVGGSNPLHAKVALHELLQDKMMQLERAVVQATADGVPGEENVPMTPAGNTRLAYYVNVLDRLQRLHAQLAADAEEAAEAPGANAVARINELMTRVQERDRLNTTLERELGEMQARLSAIDAETEQRLDGARAEGAAAERARLEGAATRADQDAAAALERAQGLEAEVARLGAELAAAREASASAASPAATVAPEREQELLARVAELEAGLAERDGTIAQLRAVADATDAKAGEAASTSEEQVGSLQRRVAELERELKHEKASSKNAQIYLQTRIDNLTQQLEQTAADGEDKSALKHVQAENDRLEVRARAARGGRGREARLMRARPRDAPPPSPHAGPGAERQRGARLDQEGARDGQQAACGLVRGGDDRGAAQHARVLRGEARRGERDDEGAPGDTPARDSVRGPAGCALLSRCRWVRRSCDGRADPLRSRPRARAAPAPTRAGS